MEEVAAVVENTIHSVVPALRRVIKYGAPTFQGLGDVCTIGVWKHFVAVGFWNGATLAARHPLLEGSAKTTRIAKIRTLGEARSRQFKALVRDAVRLDSVDPTHEK